MTILEITAFSGETVKADGYIARKMLSVGEILEIEEVLKKLNYKIIIK